MNLKQKHQSARGFRLLARLLISAVLITAIGLPAQARTRNNLDLNSLFQIDLEEVLNAVGALNLPGREPSKNQFGVDIDNFGRIDQNFYRGAQPDQKAMTQMKRLGIKTVIDLRDDNLPPAESWAHRAGLQYYRIPLSSRRLPSDEATSQFLQLVNDPKNWPVYVHCQGGRHRTGEMTAIYRITNYGWTADQAFEEMKKYQWYGFNGHQPTKDYVYDFYRRYKAGEITVDRRGQIMARRNEAASTRFDDFLGVPVRQ